MRTVSRFLLRDTRAFWLVIKPDGSEIASMPLKVVGDHLVAEGSSTHDSQVDVRISLKGPDLIDVVEMDFTLSYTE